MSAKTIPVTLADRSYDILVGQHTLSQLSSLIQHKTQAKQVAIITHEDIAQHYAEDIVNQLESANLTTHLLSVPNGESSKSLSVVTSLLERLFENRFDRHDCVMALGGGVIGDLAGFVASIYMRGIAFFQVPTTILAQVDASIGGKTGINNDYGKNLVGSFYQPKAVVIDVSVLKTLPLREARAGLAEIVKYGMIWDKAFFEYLETQASDIAKFDYDTHAHHWLHMIETSASIKADVVSKDEKESDLRAILNYGHTIAHGIEATFDYNTFIHGEAVAIGMVGASWLAIQLGHNSMASHKRLVALLQALGLPTQLPNTYDAQTIFDKMRSDKKAKQGTLRFILNQEIGQVTLEPIGDTELILTCLTYLMG